MSTIKTLKKQDIQYIKAQFIKNYSDSKTELNFKNDYQLLVAIILSAQCTDKRVNIITPKLFEEYPTIEELSKANLDEIKEIIKSCSFFNNKAKHLLQMSKTVVTKFDGQIPSNHKDLISLSGVGNKTANVFLIEFYNHNLMAVDTHVFRVSHRLGLSDAKTIKATQDDLVNIFKTDLNILHQGMVLFGRYICKAVKPDCKQCLFPQYCKNN